jgi:hypothetical protein
MKFILFALLTFVGSVQAGGLNMTSEKTTSIVHQMLDQYPRVIILDHSPTFTESAPSNSFYICRITYAIDLGYGYSRGPMLGYIAIYHNSVSDPRWAIEFHWHY